MKLPAMGLIGFALGSVTALTVNGIHNHFQQSNINTAQVNDTLLTQLAADPRAQAINSAPPGVLPLDATPEPGVPEEPGSMRPTIQFKPGFRPPTHRNISGAYLILRRTDQLLKPTKDPIWQLELVSSDGQILDKLPALTGRVDKQNASRNIAGNKAPLPRGTYSIDRAGIATAPFDDPELGRGYWVPITPLFNTNRSALGFHQDPSWGKRNGESGTSGCIGLESADATRQLVTWIKHYNVTTLKVES